MLIAFLTGDLVFPSRVAVVAARLGMRMETVATEQALRSKIEAVDFADAIVLLDLSTLGVDPAQTVAALKGHLPPPRAIVAFGPHVHEAKLAAAQAAGCDVVLSRGQFDAKMEAILLQYRDS